MRFCCVLSFVFVVGTLSCGCVVTHERRADVLSVEPQMSVPSPNAAFRAVLDYLDRNRLGRILAVEYNDEDKIYSISTYTSDSVGFLDGGGYKLILKVELRDVGFVVSELSRVSWVS